MTGFRTILLIEDDHFISDMYKRTLDASGFITTVEANGKKALELAKTQPFDLILLDIMLPQLSGRVILDRLNAHYNDSSEKPKIIVMTNFDQPDSERADMESKADGYFIKADTTPNALLEILRDLD